MVIYPEELSNQMASSSRSDQKLLSDIAQFGWHIIHIPQDEEGPGWSYTIGLYHTFKHPEIVVTGMQPDFSQVILNNFGEDIKSGKKFEVGLLYNDILDDVQCKMIEVKREHYHEHFGYAKWFYKSEDFPVLQCVYPTKSGIFPWDKEAPEGFKTFQPILE